MPSGSEFPSPHARGYTINLVTENVVDSTDWNPSWGWAAGALISTLSDLRQWAPILATGRGLLTPGTQAQRLQTVHVPGAAPDTFYGLGIFVSGGWTGHNGSIPGYETVNGFTFGLRTPPWSCPINTDILVETAAQEPSSLLGTAITSIATPGHVYGK